MHPSLGQMREPAGDYLDEPNADADAVHVLLVLKSRLQYYLLATTSNMFHCCHSTRISISCAMLGLTKLGWDL
jgi:hypothetical protein